MGNRTVSGPDETRPEAARERPGRHAVAVASIVLAVIALLSGSTRASVPAAGGSASFAAKPDATNTGVPDGTELTVHEGDITVTKDRTVLDSLDIHGSVYVRANDVTIDRSVIRGGPPSERNDALVASWWNNTNLTIRDSTLAADFPSYYLDGISGSNFRAERLDISRVVDPIKVVDGNVTVLASWMHNNAHFDPDPNQRDGKTHDDGVQIEGGSGITLTGNVIENGHNAAVMITQNHAATADVTISDNWLGGGACTVNVTQKGAGGKDAPIQGMVIRGNHFGPGRYGTTCPMRLPSTSPISVSGNFWDGSTVPAMMTRF